MLLADNSAYLSMVCSVSLNNLRKLDKWNTKEQVAELKNNLQQMFSFQKDIFKKSSKDQRYDLREVIPTRDASGNLLFIEASSEMVSEEEGWL